tara:strand:+ start:56 stop:538 length:483 start_codon:yes stop_codon:yes gene_type:complete
MKKIKLPFLIIFLLILNHCGFEPKFTVDKINYTFSEIEVNKKDNLSKKIKQNIINFSKSTSKEINKKKVLKLKINSKKDINILSKDSSGNVEIYRMSITVNLKIFDNKNLLNKKIFQKDFSYNNKSNLFDLKEYEKNIENNLASSIIEDIILHIYSIKND